MMVALLSRNLFISDYLTDNKLSVVKLKTSPVSSISRAGPIIASNGIFLTYSRLLYAGISINSKGFQQY